MYRLDHSEKFSNAGFSKLAKCCVILSAFVVLSTICTPPSLAQITYPFANNTFEANSKKLQKNFQQLLTGVTLRNAVQQISQHAQVPLWLDRRVDGEQVIDLRVQDANVQQAIAQLVDQYNLRQIWVGSVPYICRPEDVANIELGYWTIATQANGQLVARASQAWEWQQPEQPRSLIEQFAAKNDLVLSGLDRIEHDYWAPQSLPALDVATNLGLLLSGFDRTLNLESGNRWTIVPVTKETLEVAFGYDSKLLQQTSSAKSSAWQTAWKNKVQWRTQNNKRWLKAPVAAHRELYIASLNLPVAMDAPKSTSATEQALLKRRFTTHLQGRLVDILPTLFGQLKLKWVSAELTKELGEQTIDVKADNIAIDQLLQAIATDAKCIITRTGISITIQPQG